MTNQLEPSRSTQGIADKNWWQPACGTLQVRASQHALRYVWQGQTERYLEHVEIVQHLVAWLKKKKLLAGSNFLSPLGGRSHGAAGIAVRRSAELTELRPRWGVVREVALHRASLLLLVSETGVNLIDKRAQGCSPRD